MIRSVVTRFGHTFMSIGDASGTAGLAIVEDLIKGRKPNWPGVCPIPLPHAAAHVCSACLNDLRRVTQSRLAIDEYIDTLVQRAEFPSKDGEFIKGKELLEYLQSVPGIGRMTALTWAVEIWDPNRFQCEKQVAAYCGCDPSLKVSAGKVTSHQRRRGNLFLHHALIQAAGGLVRRRAEGLGEWGYAIKGRHKRGGWKKATGAVARRLALLLWHVHRRREMCNMDKYTFWKSPVVRNVPLDSLGLSPRVLQAFMRAGLTHVPQIAALFYAGELTSIKGIGDKCLQELKQALEKIKVYSSAAG
jgi:transposase